MATMNSGMGGPAGYGENVFSTTPKYSGDNDDGNVEIDITSVFSGGINFFGTTYTEIYLGVNGIITFGDSHDNDNDDGFGVIDLPAILPFYSDLDVDEGGEVYWDFDTVNGTLTITWDGVSPYDDDDDENSFQVVLTDLGSGDFHVEYIYEDIQDAYVGGDPAIAGITDGAGTVYALEGSGDDDFMESNYASNDFDHGDPSGTFSFGVINGTPDVFAVDGTSGDDSMGLGYTDVDGDQITSGDDTIDGAAGNDTILGDQGNAEIHGGSGDDSIGEWAIGGAGDDLIYGDAGDDHIIGGSGDDTVYGGDDDDWISGGPGTDSLYGGSGSDDFWVTDNHEATGIWGGESGSDNDLLGFSNYISTSGVDATFTSDEAGDYDFESTAGTGSFDEIEAIYGTNYGDTIDASATNTGKWLHGAGGNDTITGGAGDDTILTGTGDDLVVIEASSGNDTIFDFDIGDSDSNGVSNDQIDVSDLVDLDGNPVNIWDVTVSDDGAGNALLTFPGGETLTLEGITPAQMNGPQMVASGIACYAPGTLIDTPSGPRPVETLRPGDLVQTLDHGPQPIRWTRSGLCPLEDLDAKQRPVLIAAGALGTGLPAQDLVVLPQHRVLVGGGGQLEGWFKHERFAPARSLTGLHGIRHMKGKAAITWIHFACAHHEVVWANGCLSESLLLGPMVTNGLTRDERKTLHSIYGPAHLDGTALNGPPARPCLKVGAVKRHLAKGRQDSALPMAHHGLNLAQVQ